MQRQQKWQEELMPSRKFMTGLVRCDFYEKPLRTLYSIKFDTAWGRGEQSTEHSAGLNFIAIHSCD